MPTQEIRVAADKEKRHVALTSIYAAVLLTLAKLAVGLWTNSLGILSEAVHSGLDLVAAVVTWLTVRVSGRPADRDHPYGHGKFENLSALFETLLLLGTCVWIGKEAWGARKEDSNIPGCFTGAIREVKLWSRALSAEEIAALHR